jgi:hypothetical protein
MRKYLSSFNVYGNFGVVACASGNHAFAKLKLSVEEELSGVGCPALLLHNYLQHET